MAGDVKLGYYDGLTDGYGNATEYGKWMLSKGWAKYAGDGMVLVNGGVAQSGSENNKDGSLKNPDGSESQPNAPAPAAADPNALVTGNASWSVSGMTIGDDGYAWLEVRHWDPVKQDYTYQTVALGRPTDPGFSWDTVGTQTGLYPAQLRAAYAKAQLEWQQTQAGQIAMKTWRYDSIDPYTGEVTVKNGAGITDKVALSDIVSSEWRAAHPGVNLQDVQQAVQQANRSNWLASQWQDPSTGNYTPSPYLQLGQAYNPAATAGAATGTTGTGVGTPIVPGMAPGADAFHTLANAYSGATASAIGTTAAGPTPATSGSSLTGGGTTANNPTKPAATPTTSGATATTTTTDTGGTPTDPTARGGPVTGGTPNPTPTPSPSPTPATGGGTTGGTTTGTTGGQTTEQAQQKADAAQIAKILAAMKQYTNISGTDAGQYTGTDYYGKAQTLTKDQLIASGSATASDLYKAQLAYADMIRRYGQQARSGRSQYLGGYNPNALQSTVAGA